MTSEACNNDRDAGLGFVRLLDREKRTKFESYGAQSRQRQRQETRKTPEKDRAACAREEGQKETSEHARAGAARIDGKAARVAGASGLTRVIK